MTIRNAESYSIELANGKQQTFASAAEMVTWLDRQRGLDYSPKRKRGPADRKATKRQTRKPRAPKTNERPLARYANRHSGEV